MSHFKQISNDILNDILSIISNELLSNISHDVPNDIQIIFQVTFQIALIKNDISGDFKYISHLKSYILVSKSMVAFTTHFSS